MGITIKENILTKNDCYKSGRTITPIGMQLHTIGTAQNTAASLASYWNQGGVSACVHYCVDAETPNLVLHFLPDNRRSWADGSFGNGNLITVELMESDYMRYTGGANYTVTNEAKFKADVTRAYNTAVQFFAMKCKEYGWNPQEKMSNGLYRVSSHDEGRRLGLSTAHVDPTHIWNRYGWTMDQFRADVAKAMKGEIAVAKDNASSANSSSSTVYYRVRKTWADEKSQLGAYTVLENAKANCPDGYYVFDEKGNVVYPKKTENKNTASKEAKGIPASKQDYIDKVSKIAVNLYKETRILPSVIVAQTCLETGYGLGKDSTLLMEVNNLLGMKAELLSSTWAEFSVWNGKTITKRTPEVYNGVLTYINDKFRVYTDYENCIRDYEMFLLHVKNGSGYKYRKVAGMTDPREVITAISRGGYATDPSYITKVMKLIEENNLTKYDVQAGVNAKTETKTATDTATKSAKVTPYRVGTGWKSGACVGQVGAYDILANAKQRADELGKKYYVYDNNGKQVYQGKTVTKTVAEKAVEWALKTAADNSHGYNNTKGKRLGNPDYACSSFVAGAYRAAGLTSIPADSYTASMYKTFTAAGFEDVTSKVNLRTGAGTIAGDVVLRPGVHVEMVVNDKHQLVGARGNATGGATNGRAGDQGGEIEVANWWDDQWKYCLRYSKDKKTTTQKAAETAAKTTTTQYVVQAGLFTVKQNADNLAKFIKKKGFDVLVVPYKGQYCVQCGIFAVKKNANTLVSKLKNAGFDALVRAEKS